MLLFLIFAAIVALTIAFTLVEIRLMPAARRRVAPVKLDRVSPLSQPCDCEPPRTIYPDGSGGYADTPPNIDHWGQPVQLEARGVDAVETPVPDRGGKP